MGFLLVFLVVDCIDFCLKLGLDWFCFWCCLDWLLVGLWKLDRGLLLDWGSGFWCVWFLVILFMEYVCSLSGCGLNRCVELGFWSWGLGVCSCWLLGLLVCLMFLCVLGCCWWNIVFFVIGWYICCLWIRVCCFFRLICWCVFLSCCCFLLVLVWRWLICYRW